MHNNEKFWLPIDSELYNLLLRNKYLINRLNFNIQKMKELNLSYDSELANLYLITAEYTELEKAITETLKEFKGILNWGFDYSIQDYIYIDTIKNFNLPENKYNLIPKEKPYPDFISEIFPELSENLSSQQTATKTITFQVTEDCNLKCTYCYQHNKTNHKMDYNLAIQFIDLLLNDKIPYCTTKNTGAIVIDFIGGEPLLEIDLVDKLCEYISNQMIIKNHPWKNFYYFSMSSNGVLYFNPKVQDFLKKYDSIISYSVSIDGNKELHDKCRVFPNGTGSYDQAIAASLDWQTKRKTRKITKMTLSPENIEYIYEATINLINLGFEIIMLNCVYENVWTLKDAQKMYKELLKVIDYLFENNLYNKVFYRLFEEDAGTPMHPTDNNNFCGGTNDMLAIDYEGNLYPCIRYMPSSLGDNQIPYTIGKIENNQFIQTNEHKKRNECLNCITRRSQSTDECFDCPIATGCGWCSGYNYECFGTPDKRATGICIMHKARCLAAYEFKKRYNKAMGIDEEVKCNLKPEWIKEIKGE